MSSIGIMGGGWLGLALAEKAIVRNHSIKVSTTRKEKSTLLKKKGINAAIVDVSEFDISGDIDFFNDLNHLIISIPPGLRKNPDHNYIAVIGRIINKIELTGIEKVIFTSSTSVYGNQSEIITEESELLGTTAAARQIIAVEKNLLEHKQFESCILRLGGLVGPNRHPIFTLSGKKNIPNPLSPINFIHQQDAVNIILHIIENWQGKQVYNAVTPFHPTRIDYYSEMAKIAALEAPAFEKSGIIKGIVSAKKVRKDLNFKFLVKNLLILN
ncbi:MAG: NAD(P)-dependent oxidoreductase [Flavobacteriaceae bacterium]|nr:NAD(P)-dependent oxidoreductase [Flavobacteriaceae bacterium]